METCQFLFTKLLSHIIDPSFFKNPTASIKSQGESDRNHFSKYLLTLIVNFSCSLEDGLLVRSPTSPNILLSLNAKSGERKSLESNPLDSRALGTEHWEFYSIYFPCRCNEKQAPVTARKKKKSQKTKSLSSPQFAELALLSPAQSRLCIYCCVVEPRKARMETRRSWRELANNAVSGVVSALAKI